MFKQTRHLQARPFWSVQKSNYKYIYELLGVPVAKTEKKT